MHFGLLEHLKFKITDVCAHVRHIYRSSSAQGGATSEKPMVSGKHQSLKGVHPWPPPCPRRLGGDCPASPERTGLWLTQEERNSTFEAQFLLNVCHFCTLQY